MSGKGKFGMMFWGCRHTKRTDAEVSPMPDGNVMVMRRCEQCGARFYKKYKDDRLRRCMKISEDDWPMIGELER